MLGVIADDFTGATDIAALIARSGARVVLHTGTPGENGAACDDTPDAIVIALKCRTIPADDAVASCLEACEFLLDQGAQTVFWKYCSTFDSSEKGNIGPVAEALMQRLDTQQTVYCPAFPENRRRVFMGHLFVDEEPLNESPMKDHPLTPMRDSSLVRLLKPQVTGAVYSVSRPVLAKGPEALRDRLKELVERGCAHIICDAIDDGDLAIWAEAIADMPLITGGSAIAEPLARRMFARIAGQIGTARNAHSVGRDAPAIVLSGSCSAMSQEQVAAFAPHSAVLKLDPLQLAEEGEAAARKWLSDHLDGDLPILVTATADAVAVTKVQEALGVAAAGDLVEKTIANLAIHAFNLGARRFVVAGGETSGAVTHALGVQRLEIGPEIAPGVPWTFSRRDGETFAIALKSGNFGDVTFFSDALEVLDEQ